MSPPAEPRAETVRVTFVDRPAAIQVSETFIPLATSYPNFLSFLNALSSSVAHKLDNLPTQHVEGQGFTLCDGGWWYRFVSPATPAAGEAAGEAARREPTRDKGPWTLLDCLFGYEKMVGELCLGVKWKGAGVEVQHNLQKKRDDAGINQTHDNGSSGPIFLQVSAPGHDGRDSAPAEPDYTRQDEPQHSERHDDMSMAKDARPSGYPSEITTPQSHGRDSGGYHDGFIRADGGRGPRMDEGNVDAEIRCTYAPPLIVSSPVVGVVPPDGDDIDDDDGDNVTPKPSPSTPVANPSHTIIEPLKGPGGITYLPAYPARALEPPLETGLNSPVVSEPPPDPEPKFYPPPPGATGSPNDKYRQVPRSGGAIRNPHRTPYPYPYQYQGSDRQLSGGAVPFVFDQQPHCPPPHQNTSQSTDNSPAGSFNQSANFVNQASPRGSYRGRVRGKYDVRKVRGGYDKKAYNRYGSRNHHRYGGRPSGPDNTPRFPLDPALEVNYRKYSRPDNYDAGPGQHSDPNSIPSQYHRQNPYDGDGHSAGNDSAYRYSYPSLPAFHNDYSYPSLPAFHHSASYYSPSAFTAQAGEGMPSLKPEIEMTAPTPVAALLAQEQPRPPFVPSPLAPSFIPRASNVRQEHAEQHPAEAQHRYHPDGQSHAMASDTSAFQYQLQGYGMLPLAAGPVIATTLMPPGAVLMSQAPQLVRYKRPKPAGSLPPIGEFSPPKARKNGRQAQKILDRVLAGSAADAVGAAGGAAPPQVDNGGGAVVGDGDELEDGDDGDSEYIPQDDGRKKKYRKSKKPKNKRRAGGHGDLGRGAHGQEEKADDGQGGGPSAVEPLTVTMAMTPTTAMDTAPLAADSEAQVGVDEDEKMVEG